MRRIFSYLAVAIVALAVPAFAGPALAQTAPAGTSPTDRCAAAGDILARLPGVVTTVTTTVPDPPGAGATTTYNSTVPPGLGIEISAGTISGDTRFGATFVGNTSGDLTGVLVSSVNYTPPSPGPNVTNDIVGGEWALCGPQGTVYGTFTSGTVQWNVDESLADVAANMTIAGGSINGIPVSGTGTFSGVLDHRPLQAGLPPTINGVLQLQASAIPATDKALPGTGGPQLAFPLAALLVVSCTLGLCLRRRFS